MAEVDDSLFHANSRVTLAPVIPGSIIGKNKIPMRSKIIRCRHIDTLSADAQSMGDDHHANRLQPLFMIDIARQLLSQI